jgi:hypothetical protein
MRWHGYFTGESRVQELLGVTDDVWSAQIDGVAERVEESKPALHDTIRVHRVHQMAHFIVTWSKSNRIACLHNLFRTAIPASSDHPVSQLIATTEARYCTLIQR